MIVSPLYMRGRNLSWMSHRKNRDVWGVSLPTDDRATRDAAKDMLMFLSRRKDAKLENKDTKALVSRLNTDVHKR